MEPIFPPELEQTIFEMAFDASDRNNNEMLMLVARRTRIWIRPLVYRIYFNCTQSTYSNLFPPRLNHPSSYVGQEQIYSFVKAIAIDSNRQTVGQALALIEDCYNVENLACWGGLILCDLWPVISTRTHLRRLSGAFEGLTQEHFRSPSLSNLTHLEIIYPSAEWSLDSLSLLTSLTHLAIYRDPEINLGIEYHQRLARILPKCRCLRVYIECIANDIEGISEGALDFNATEPRMVIFDFSMLEPEDWITGAEGGKDAWWHAENVIFARQCKYLLCDDNQNNVISTVSPWTDYLTEEGKIWHSSLS